jgi:hypothetical protein
MNNFTELSLHQEHFTQCDMPEYFHKRRHLLLGHATVNPFLRHKTS